MDDRQGSKQVSGAVGGRNAGGADGTGCGCGKCGGAPYRVRPDRASGRAPDTLRADRAARALGWFSLALGMTEVLLAAQVARAAGLRGREGLIRACGLREIATGAAILVARRPAPGIMARLAGDAMDLAVLGTRAASGKTGSSGASVGLAAVLGVTAADAACARALTAGAQASPDLDDYRQRSGFPQPAAQMRGAARADFTVPADMRVPAALRPYGT